MCRACVIAIDGPAGSGKSTLGRELARRMGYLYLDTGVLYRALTLLAIRHNVDVHDERELQALSQRYQIDVQAPVVDDGRQCTVVVGGEDVTWEIRSPLVDENVSIVAAHPAVRAALLPAQRGIAARGRVVIVGRDIGTVVAPDADLKIFLEAALDVRAKRRREDLLAQGHCAAALEEVRADLAERDRLDSGRSSAPLIAASDAVKVRNEGSGIEAVVDQLERLANASSQDC